MPVSVLVLAGERPAPSRLCQQEGVASKAEIAINDRAMLDHVLGALGDSGLEPPVHIAGAHETTRARLSGSATGARLEYLPAQPGGPAASVAAAMEAIGRFPLLVTTCDHPLLTPAIIADFLDASLASGADLTFGLATRATIEAAYPEAVRTYFPIGGAKVSGCNLFLLTSPRAGKAIDFWRQAEHDRKHPARIARRFGLLSALRILRPGISMDSVFRVLSRRLGCSLSPVMLDHAHAAIDVDKPEDLALVRAIMSPGDL